MRKKQHAITTVHAAVSRSLGTRSSHGPGRLTCFFSFIAAPRDKEVEGAVFVEGPGPRSRWGPARKLPAPIFYQEWTSAVNEPRAVAGGTPVLPSV